MRPFQLFIFSIAIFSISNGDAQSPFASTKFNIHGQISGRDTGSVMFWYNDEKNNTVSDTVRLNKGTFNFSGTVNRVCEGYLWTDMKNRVLDDPSVIRFLLEPANIAIYAKKGNESNVIIRGSKSQIDKQNWDKEKSYLLIPKARLYKTLYSLLEVSKTTRDPTVQETLNKLGSQIDSINNKIRQVDLGYISTHPTSYLSGYLLSRHKRNISVDSIQAYYTGLSRNVQNSSVGHDVLDYLYPLTDDEQFRKAHPLIDLEFDERLEKINSNYEFSLKDTSEVTVNLSSFKSKYLVIDFWASWCKPCIANVPSMNQMINEYRFDSIQFISVSLDKDIAQWKESLIKNKFMGVQLSDLNGFGSLIAVYCKVLWVPKYIIADKNGRIINYDAPQPSEPELKVLLDDLVNKR